MEASLPTLTCTSHLKAPRKGWLQTSLFAYKHRDSENKKFSNGTCKLRGAGLVAVKTGVASPRVWWGHFLTQPLGVAVQLGWASVSTYLAVKKPCS